MSHIITLITLSIFQMTLGKTVITLASAVSAVAILGSLVSLGKDIPDALR